MKFSRGAINGTAMFFVLAALTLILLALGRGCSCSNARYRDVPADTTSFVTPIQVDTVTPQPLKKKKRSSKPATPPRVIPTRSPLDDKL